MKYACLFWRNGSLRPLEILCLLSILSIYPNVLVFGYERPANLPDGVDWVNANEIVPEAQFWVHSATNSPALGTDVFRYRIIKQQLGIWFDFDVILLKKLDDDLQHIYAWQSTGLVNGAVLNMPKDSPALDALLDLSSDPYVIPPFIKFNKRCELLVRKMIGRPTHLTMQPWGSLGPNALTYFLGKTGEIKYALSKETFYPVPYTEAHRFLIKDGFLENSISSNNYALHLWNEMLRKPSKLRPNIQEGTLIIENGSFVQKFAKERFRLNLPEIS